MITLVSSFVIANALISFETIHKSFASLNEFDKTVDASIVTYVLTFLSILYITRHIHGLLLIYSNPGYKEKLELDWLHVPLFYVVSMLIVLSLVFCVRIDMIISPHQSLFERSFSLLAFYSFPVLLWLFLDMYHFAFSFSDHNEPETKVYWSDIVSVFTQCFKHPFDRKSIYDCKSTWIVISSFTLLTVLVWVITVGLFGRTEQIYYTWTILFINFFLHTGFDYVFNSRYFFYGFPE